MTSSSIFPSSFLKEKTIDKSFIIFLNYIYNLNILIKLIIITFIEETMKKFNWQLMTNNILAQDKKALISFIKSSNKFTNGPKVKEFEKKWSKWLELNIVLL